jgi:hypothetical protein
MADTAVLMLHLFVPSPSFGDWGGYPSVWTNLSQLLAELIVIASLAALTLTLCRALAMLTFGELLALPEGYGPPTSQHVTLCI